MFITLFSTKLLDFLFYLFYISLGISLYLQWLVKWIIPNFFFQSVCIEVIKSEVRDQKVCMMNRGMVVFVFPKERWSTFKVYRSVCVEWQVVRKPSMSIGLKMRFMYRLPGDKLELPVNLDYGVWIISSNNKYTNKENIYLTWIRCCFQCKISY